MILTDKIVPSIPAKDAWKNKNHIDFMAVLDSFDPSALSATHLLEFMSRNPFYSGYFRFSDETLWKLRCKEYNDKPECLWDRDFLRSADIQIEPINYRYGIADSALRRETADLSEAEKKYWGAVDVVSRVTDEDIARRFKRARQLLIRAIGSKATLYFVKKEYESFTEEERTAQDIAYQNKMDSLKQSDLWSEEALWELDYEKQYALPEKLIRLRKAVRGSDGKAFTQRDFAKLIGYPINKYTEYEQAKINSFGETGVYGHAGRRREVCEIKEPDPVLVEKLVMTVHANPYWLLDEEVEAEDGELPEEYEQPDSEGEWNGMWYENKKYFGYYGSEYDDFGEKVMPAQGVFAPYDLILKWIKEGKPMNCDGRFWDN